MSENPKAMNPLKLMTAMTRLAAVVGLAILGLAGCATPPPTPMGANQARVTGRWDFGQGWTVMLAPAGTTDRNQFKREMIVPAGPQRLAIRINMGSSSGAIFEMMADKWSDRSVAEIEFKAQPGHDYRAEWATTNLRAMAYRVVDTASGATVGEAKP